MLDVTRGARVRWYYNVVLAMGRAQMRRVPGWDMLGISL